MGKAERRRWRRTRERGGKRGKFSPYPVLVEGVMDKVCT